MSFQFAMMAAGMGMSLLQGINSAAGAAQQGAAADANTRAAADQKIMGAQVKSAQYTTAAAETGTEIAGAQLTTQQQEIQRQRQIAQLWQANAIDQVGRGGVSGDGGSGDVIQAYNAGIGAEDIANIKLMGESKVNQLSFRQTQYNLAASASDLDALNAGDNATRQISQQDAQTSNAETGIVLNTLGKLVGGASAFGGGSSGGNAGKFTGSIDDATRAFM
jgi:hypothetical protein